MNQDGSVRELSPGERTYLSTKFSGGDGGRPYIKFRHESRDGWGSLSGFIERRRVPARVEIAPCHPDFDAREKALRVDLLDSLRAAGDRIDLGADGSTSSIPNPQLTRRERFDRIRTWQLARQAEREKLAMRSPEEKGD